MVLQLDRASGGGRRPVRLTAFDIDDDGGLSGRRVSADGVSSDGICLDAEGAVWTSAGMSTVVRVAEGGQVLQRVALGENRAPFAVMLGARTGGPCSS